MGRTKEKMVPWGKNGSLGKICVLEDGQWLNEMVYLGGEWSWGESGPRERWGLKKKQFLKEKMLPWSEDGSGRRWGWKKDVVQG
jgi:hypothetical protein